jgi:hypothetical protein
VADFGSILSRYITGSKPWEVGSSPGPGRKGADVPPALPRLRQTH